MINKITIFLFTIYLTSCTKNEAIKQQAQSPLIQQAQLFRCMEGSPSIVIYDPVDETFKYCANGVWEPAKLPTTQPQAASEEIVEEPVITVDHKTPDAHKGFSQTKKQTEGNELKKEQAHQRKGDTYWCRTEDDKDNYKCSLAH